MTTDPSPLSRPPRSGRLSESPRPPEEGEVTGRSDQEGLLVEVNAILSGNLETHAALVQVLSKLKERMHCARARIHRLGSHDHLLHCIAESSDSTSQTNLGLSAESPSLAAAAARGFEALYEPDSAARPDDLGGNAVIRSRYAVPLLRGSDVLGVLEVASERRDGIRAVASKLVDQVAAQIALALERDALHRELKISQERFRAIFEQRYFGVSLCDQEGRYCAVNAILAQLLGYSPEELQGRPFWDFLHPDDRAPSAEIAKSLFDGSKSNVTLEHRYLRKSGSTVWCKVNMSLTRNAEGGPAYLLQIIEDISEWKKAGEEQAQLREQLAQAQKMEAIGTLAGGLAHDFNNFLGVILGFASLMRVRLQPGDPLLEPVRMIEQSAESAADLTRQLLGLARQEGEERVAVSVDDILKRLLKIITRTFDRRIQVETRLSPGLPAVEAAVNQLQHAILNLCINARDAMPEGGRLVLESALASLGADNPLRPPQHPPGDYVQITVTDSGLGIEPQAMAHLFEPFFTTKKEGGGTGLGLAMVYRTVHHHGGFVRAESEVVRGSRFSIYLPAAQRPSQPLGREESAHLEYGSGTVLVIDDEPLVLAFAQRALEKLGYNVLTAESAKHAREIYASRAREIDYVLLDMVMPEMSGFETFQRLREINPQAKIILSSGYSLDRVAREVRQMGAADFIGKPYSLETLSLALKRVLHN